SAARPAPGHPPSLWRRAAQPRDRRDHGTQRRRCEAADLPRPDGLAPPVGRAAPRRASAPGATMNTEDGLDPALADTAAELSGVLAARRLSPVRRRELY